MFDEIMKYCPFLREVIENKINDEVAKAKSERDLEVAELKKTIENLTATLLMGGN